MSSPLSYRQNCHRCGFWGELWKYLLAHKHWDTLGIAIGITGVQSQRDLGDSGSEKVPQVVQPCLQPPNKSQEAQSGKTHPLNVLLWLISVLGVAWSLLETCSLNQLWFHRWRFSPEQCSLIQFCLTNQPSNKPTNQQTNKPTNQQTNKPTSKPTSQQTN